MMSKWICLFLAIALVGCRGSDGHIGASGGNGPSLVFSANEISDIPNSNCPNNGGLILESGIDDDSDEELDIPEEVDHTVSLCHGETGLNGQTTILWPTAIAPGSSLCGAQGGMQIDMVLDLNEDLQFDPNDPEPILGFFTVCNGLEGIQGIPGIEGPIGPQGASGSNSLLVLNLLTPSANQQPCPTGGTQVNTGLDSNNNSILDPTEISFSQPICNGLNSFICPTTGDYPEYCVDGGTKWEVGIDWNNDGHLDISEIDESKTTYACFPCYFAENVLNPLLACRRDFGDVFASTTSYLNYLTLEDKVNAGPNIAIASNGTVYLAAIGEIGTGKWPVHSFSKTSLFATTQQTLDLPLQTPLTDLFYLSDIDTDGTDVIIPLHNSTQDETEVFRWNGLGSASSVLTTETIFSDPLSGLSEIFKQFVIFDTTAEVYFSAVDQEIVQFSNSWGTSTWNNNNDTITALSLAGYQKKDSQGNVIAHELYSVDFEQGVSPNRKDITVTEVGSGGSNVPQLFHTLGAGIPVALAVDSKGNIYVSCIDLNDPNSNPRSHLVDKVCDEGSVIKIDAQGNEIPIIKTSDWILDMDYLESEHTLVIVTNQNNQYVIERFRLLEDEQGYQHSP
jgi:hypothetical protein